MYINTAINLKHLETWLWTWEHVFWLGNITGKVELDSRVREFPKLTVQVYNHVSKLTVVFPIEWSCYQMHTYFQQTFRGENLSILISKNIAILDMGWQHLLKLTIHMIFVILYIDQP